MAAIQEQTQLASEVSEAISTGVIGTEIDEVRISFGSLALDRVTLFVLLS
jgi:hypothetical protein